MSTIQRYISKELTHFVGKGLSEEEQYLLLVDIIISGWLTPPPHMLDEAPHVVVNTKGRISLNEMYKPTVVCFCDIPVTDIHIHMSKYSRFGLSFLKRFLISKGANPVFYVAKNSVVGNPTQGHSARAEEFDKVMDTYQSLFSLVTNALSRIEGKGRTPQNVTDMFVRVHLFLTYNVFSFLQAFDDSLPDEDPGNFYMEREWRMLGNLRFAMDDVYRVILPQSFAERFRKDVPTYNGQVTFVD
jgi:hypothetical protein